MTTPQSDPAPARQRIAKLMARVGLCSRRDAEAWIVEGRVSVNGDVLTSPAHDVGPDDAILVDGAPLPAAQKTRLFMFHKPRGLVTSDRDPEGRATVTDFLRDSWPDGPRVVTVGRLDINTEGLLLLTNDGGLARVLELPKTGWVRRYRVRAKGETDQAALDRLRDGVTIEGVDYAGIEATLDRTQGANVWLTMALREGKNREVKRVLEHVGLEVNRLIRLSFGPFQLGDLAEGAVEEVRTRVLRDQLGAALAAAAGVAFEDAAPPPESRRAEKDRKPRTAGAERVNKGERPARGGRDERGVRESGERGSGERKLGGDRPLRRPRETAPPEPIRERPVAGARKHVSTLRSEGSEAARHGPRRRIERSDVTDRRERSVRVERLIDARPALEPTRARGERPGRREETGTGRRHASPSALAKRARTARSGGYGVEREDAALPRRGRPDARERPARGDGGDRKFGDKPRRDAGPRAARDRTGAARAGAGHDGGGRRDAAGGHDRPRSDARPRVDRPGGDERRRRDGAPDARRRDAPRVDGPRRDAPGGGKPRAGKRFDDKRPGAKPDHAPRGAAREASRGGESREPARRDARAGRDAPHAGGNWRGAPGGAPRGGGGKPPSRPGGRPTKGASDKRPTGGGPRGQGRGKPRPKG